MPKQVRSLSVYKKIIDRLPEFRLISPPLDLNLASILGFDGMPSEGDSILPAVIGRATNFNARGREIVRRDLPMETLSRMIHTTWQDWHGQTHHGIQHRDYEAYIRDLIPPPEEFLTIMVKNGHLVASSRVVRNDEDSDAIVNILNLFLEIFAKFEIVEPSLESAISVKKINWKILPPGQYPFKRAKEALEEYLEKLDDDDREVAEERIKAITQSKPDFVAVGIGGFSDYIVFGFTDKKRYVLESPNFGNATYIFRNEWENISKFTKKEILAGEMQEARLIHNQRWSRDLRTAISRE